MKDQGPRGNVRWAFDESMTIDCPACDAEADKPCVGKKDQDLGTVHIERLHAYHESIGAKVYALRHSGGSIIGKRNITRDRHGRVTATQP